MATQIPGAPISLVLSKAGYAPRTLEIVPDKNHNLQPNLRRKSGRTKAFGRNATSKKAPQVAPVEPTSPAPVAQPAPRPPPKKPKPKPKPKPKKRIVALLD